MLRPGFWGRRLAAVALLGLASAAGAECGFRLLEADLTAINRALQQGCISSQDLVRLYLARIEAYEPKINAMISLNPRALERAGALDAERNAWGPRSPLHGIPILLKDNFDTAGPLARSVADAAVALGVMAGVDEADPRTLPSKGKVQADYTRYLKPGALARARIGVVRDYLGGNPQVDAIFERSLEAMAALGAELVEVPLPQEVKAAGPRLPDVLGAEFRPQLAKYLKSLGKGAPDSFSELVRGTEAAGSGDGLSAVNPKLVASLNMALEHPGLGDVDYLYTVSNRFPAARGALQRLFRGQRLSALTFPTLACPPAPAFGEQPDPDYLCQVDDVHNAGYLRIASVTGFPDISVPAGMTRAGLPVGLSFFGLPYSEPTLIGLAYAFEQHTRARTPPATVPALVSSTISSQRARHFLPQDGLPAGDL